MHRYISFRSTRRYIMVDGNKPVIIDFSRSVDERKAR
jgi:serine/threonine-protein kinase RIO1